MNREQALDDLTAAILTAKQRLYDYGVQPEMILRIDACASHLNNLLSRLMEPNKDDLGAALSSPCACGGREPIAVKEGLWSGSEVEGVQMLQEVRILFFAAPPAEETATE